MLRRVMILTVVAMLSVALVPAVAAADESVDDAVYLSLGTSLAAGTIADANGDSTFNSNVAYTDQLFQRLEDRIDADLAHVKLGCAGETTDQFVGGTNDAGHPSNCASLYVTGSQMGDALLTLSTQNVALITIDLGANDIIQAQQQCGLDVGCLTAEIEQIGINVATIAATLRFAGAYDGPIIGMNYFNPQVGAAIGFYSGLPGPLLADPAFAELSDQLAQGLNAALAAAYAFGGAEVADVYTAFNAGDFGDDKPANGVYDNVDRLCALTYMCPDDEGVKANIHANKKGYKVIAKTFFEVYKTID